MHLMFSNTPQHPARSATTVVILSSLWLAVLGNLALWKTLMGLPDLTGWHGVGFGVAFALIIACMVTVVLSLFAWRLTLKPAVTLLLLLAAFATHYMLMYGVVVDTPMLINVLQTDTREARDQLSWRLLFTVLGLAVLPMVWLWRQRISTVGFGKQLLRNVGLFVGALVLAFGTTQLVFQDFSSLMRNYTEMRYQINPLNSIYAVLDMTVIPAEQPLSLIHI